MQWGVAMGNAGPKARAVANAVVGSNDEDGVAEAITKYVLQPRQADKADKALAGTASALPKSA